jgi:hypothetical protein
MSDIHPTPQNSGTGWVKGIIQIMWTKCHELWLMRNKDQHGDDPTSKKAAKLATIRRRMEFYYNKKSMCHPTSQQQWFYNSVNQHLQEVTNIKELLSWLDVYPRLINKQLSDIASNSQTGQQTLHRYFGVTTNDPQTSVTVPLLPNREGIG